MIPAKLKPRDEIRVVAPAESMAIIAAENQKIAHERLVNLGFKISFGKNINESDRFLSSSIESRLSDLHQAFANKNIKMILTVIGGYNSNQILDFLDYDLIKANPKIICGFSDITALNTAIYTKTGLVTYCGPHYSSFAERDYFDYSLDYFKKCLFSEEPFEVKSSENWSNDPWYKDQDGRQLEENQGYWIFNRGQAEGKILGGNIGTLNLLQGTPYFPNLTNSLLFLEDDSLTDNIIFDRFLQSLIQQPNFDRVLGLAIGRFEKASKISREDLEYIIKTKKELKNLPVVANLDFGHTEPRFTFPIGGRADLKVLNDSIQFTILEH